MRVVHRFHVARSHNPRPTQIVLLFLAVELGLRLADGDAETLRLEGIDRLAFLFRIHLHLPVADPLGVKERIRRDFADLAVLATLQPHALPVGHLALGLRGGR